ncbi:MAG: flagellar hook-associated protein FlgK [Nitrospiraceae bacterium]|nr:MAG: flagellar hook-associated protein FlgK [Nitrospiraceae bacterium]
MSLFGLFDIGKSALFASQKALNVVSNNIANVNTPGYNRQEVILEVSNSVQIGGDFLGRGVRTSEIRRHYDKFIHMQIIGQNQSFGRSYALDRGLSNLEQILNETKDLGLSDSLKNYFNAWQGVATNPESQTQRTILLQQAKTLVQNAKQIERDISDILKDVNDEIVNVVGQVNSIASQISQLNEKIAQTESGQNINQASNMRDQRDKLLNDLAELTNYTWYEDDSKYVTVLIGGRSLVTPLQSYELSATEDIEGNNSITFGGADITSMFEKGKLGGNIDVRDDIKSETLAALRKLVASIVKETNSLHQTGYGLDSSTGNDFFNPLQIFSLDYSSGAYITSSVVSDVSTLTLDEYDINFTDASSYEVYNKTSGALVTSGTYSAGATISFEGIDVVIDGSPAGGDSFFISPLNGVIENFNVEISDIRKISAASSDQTLPGDNTKALQMYQLSQGGISDLDGSTFENYYSGIISNVGVMSKAASDSLTYDDNLLFELQKKRDETSGVSLDEEAANLIRYQRSYEAGARILKVTDELLQTIINL